MKKSQKTAKSALSLALAATVVMGGTGSAVFAEETESGAAWINSVLAGQVTEETEADARSDFYLSVNKDWILSQELDSEDDAASPAAEVEDIEHERLMRLLTDESIPGEEAQVIRNIREAVANWDQRNELGYEPLMFAKEKIGAIETLDDVRDYWDSDIYSYTGVMYELDYNTNKVYIEEPVLLTDPVPAYIDETEDGKKSLNFLEDLGVYVLQRMGFTEEEANDYLQHCEEFEKQLAPVMYSPEDRQQEDYPDRTNNVYTFEELADLYGNYPIQYMLETDGYNTADSFIVTNPEAAKKLGELWTEDQVENIRGYLMIHENERYAALLDRESYDTYAELEEKYWGYTQLPEDDDELALDLIQKSAGQLLENVYAQEYCSEEIKQEIIDMSQEIIGAVQEIVGENTWMTEETREKAVNKLKAMKVTSCYPDTPYDTHLYQAKATDSPMKIWRDGLTAARADQVERINAKKERADWSYEGAIVYSPAIYNLLNDNTVNIMAGVVCDQYYQPDWSYEKKLAYLGTIIAEKVVRAVDYIGAQYDENGEQNPWWTEEDTKAFDERIQKVADFYSAQDPLGDGNGYDGENVKGVASADITGMQALLRLAKQHEDFNYEEFFTEYARGMAEVATEDIESDWIENDTTPISYLRVNSVLQQFDEFNETFGIEEGDGMYLATEDRLLVW